MSESDDCTPPTPEQLAEWRRLAEIAIEVQHKAQKEREERIRKEREGLDRPGST